jgi:hypothetical protein
MPRTLALAAALLLAPALASAQAQWDQEKVTAIAEELAASLKDLRITLRTEPDQPPGRMHVAQYAAREDVRLLVNTTQRLAAALKEGEGQLETLPIYRRIVDIRRDAEENAKRGDAPAPTRERIEKSREILARLAPYYTDVAAQ